jgi:AraC-like DNA-binding protein
LSIFDNTGRLKSASQRIAFQFFDLLEKQFNALEENKYEMTLKFPGDFAAALFIHINHLNKCLKEITGKTTSQLIAQRKIQEAKKLLQHSALTIESIRELLGFREVAHLNGFFRKHTGISPARFRRIVWNLQ